MSRADIVSQWNPTQQFAVISTARRRKLTTVYEKSLLSTAEDRLRPIHYLEVDNRGNKGATIYYALNGTTASSTLATGAADGTQPSFRLPPDSIDRLYVLATSISVISAGNATTIYLITARL